MKEQISWTHCVSVCADGAPPMIRTKIALLVDDRGKQQYLGIIDIVKKFISSWPCAISFKANQFITLVLVCKMKYLLK